MFKNAEYERIAKYDALYRSSENANKNKIWKLAEMDADRVTAWSKGGATDRANCEMLCKSHNRAKGNR
ncbi:MAG: HNH endonuclease [Fibrobacter sp.]|nr:HNH endonuclease [Fibrobacter sp. UWH5]MDO4947293.1 HNH endonuclease [Fibrobacter sp.]